MHTGLGLQFAALDGRYTDAEVFERELAFGRRAEAVGFESVWTSEHHFADYQLTPQPPMFLSWLAGQTTTLKLGTMVTVLPWHDPIRVAEMFSVLDHLSGGRAVLGMGRGLGRMEFDAFRLDMNRSRDQFTEYSEAILSALETGWMEHDGDVLKQPKAEIRPRPLRTFRGRAFASAVSPASMKLMAQLGVGLMVIAQKPWETTEEELATYRERFLEFNGYEAPKPILVVVAGVGKDAATAKELREVWLQRWARSTVDHYEFDNPGFAHIKGYEYYGALASNINKHGLESFNGFLADLQVWGTPDQVTEKLLDYAKRSNAGGLIVPLCFGGMPTELANEGFELFASEVLPELQRHDVGGDIGVAYDAPIGEPVAGA